MKLTYNRKSKDPIYYIQKSVRNGKKTTSKTVCRIGKHSELLHLTEDPLSYAKQKLKEYNEEYGRNTERVSFSVDFSQPVPSGDEVFSCRTEENVGYLYLQQLYRQLELDSFFNSIQAGRESNSINRFLVFERILNPGSEEHRNQFFGEPDFNQDQILQVMQIVSENRENYLAHIGEKTCNGIAVNCAINPVVAEKISRDVIGYTAMVLCRILQIQLEKNGEEFTTDDIVETLSNMNVDNTGDVFFKASYCGSPVLKAMEEVIPLQLDRHYYHPADLRKKVKRLQKESAV